MSEPDVDLSGNKFWWQHGKLHCNDGPAIIWADGGEEWWQNGQLHRVDGPASVYADGREYWFQNGLLHRVDGPAVTNRSGVRGWYVLGQNYQDLNLYCAAADIVGEYRTMFLLQWA